MRLAGQRRRVTVDEVRSGRGTHRVIRPARPASHGLLYEKDWGFDFEFEVDGETALDLACAWWLAARSPHTLVHLPLRTAPRPCAPVRGEGSTRFLDLVLLHHSLGFRLSRWKEVRARLSTGRPHTVTLPEDALADLDREVYDRYSHRGFRDHVIARVAVDTLFLVGSKLAFEMLAREIRGLVEDTPAHLAADPEAHCCAEIDVGTHRTHPTSRGDHWALHVAACNTHW